jgi:hypothetical protein
MAPRVDENRRLYQQVAGLRAKYPGSQAQWKRGALTWTGAIQPGPLCGTYTIRISWDGHRKRPVVRVLSPRLAVRGGEPLPHVFPGDELCLYYPGEWSPDMAIADTIIAWTSEWLFFYELWLATGEWHGGGHDPTSSKAEETTRPERSADQPHRDRRNR